MWHDFEEEKVCCYVSANFQYRPNLAIFSFFKTLVKGASFTKNRMFLFSSGVIPFLSKVNQNGAVIIIENKFSKLNSVLLIEEFCRLLEKQEKQIEFIALFILSPNRYKKPNTNILSIIENLYIMGGCNIQGRDWFNMTKSIVVGTNAGRHGSHQIRADENDCDRAFAHNLGIKVFRTPEDVFLNAAVMRRWTWKVDTVGKFLEEQKNKQEPEFSSFIDSVSDKKKLIFIAGAPASGKTLLARRLLDFLKRSNINTKNSVSMLDINTSNTGDICEAIDSFNENINMTLIITDMLYDETFIRYLNIVNASIDIICVELDSILNLCVFLDRFRLQVTTSSKLIELKKEYIARWFLTKRTKWPNVKYVPFPLMLRTRPESFFHY